MTLALLAGQAAHEAARAPLYEPTPQAAQVAP